MSRVIVVAGALLAFFASAEARPVWRHVPTPLPLLVHLAKVRPPWIGPVWRSAPMVAFQAATAKTAATSPPVADVTPPAAAAPMPAPVADVAIAAAPSPPPAALVAVKPAAPVVVAQKAADPAPPSTPIAAPATVETAAARPTPWLDYIGAFAMAIVLGGAIFFLTRDRKTSA